MRTLNLTVENLALRKTHGILRIFELVLAYDSDRTRAPLTSKSGDTPRILITGGSGLLALGWAAAFRDRAQIQLGTHIHRVRLMGAEAVQIDLTSRTAVLETVGRIAPSVMIHTAGLTSVDQCQQQPALAREVNIELAANVAEAAREEDVRLIHISTDHLFAGDRPFSSETDPAQPVNVYGETKLEAERRVLAIEPRALVVRTNFFGWSSAIRRSLSDWIIDGLRGGRELTLFEDAFFTPILIEDLAEAAMELSAAGVAGIVNIVGDERVSKLEFGLRLARRFRLSEALIRAGKITNSSLQAPRPRDMSLSNVLANRFLGRPLGCLDGFFDSLARQEASGLAREIHNAVTE